MAWQAVAFARCGTIRNKFSFTYYFRLRRPCGDVRNSSVCAPDASRAAQSMKPLKLIQLTADSLPVTGAPQFSRSVRHIVVENRAMVNV
jgi:hypothetical protein